MARKVLLETGYTFVPSTKTIVIPKVINRERLVLITNVTTNTVIYNFSDPNLRATSYATNTTVNGSSTSIVLNYNTASMSSTDKLSIIIDEYDEAFRPAETFQDPVNKFRVSTPQALIDTDFEYGTQITKWENLALVNHRPFVFPSPIGIGTINYIQFPTNGRTVTVGCAAAAPGVGTAISVQDTYLNIANGNYIVDSVTGSGNTIFSYTAKAVNTSGITQIFDPFKTGIFSGTVYANARIGGVPTYRTSAGTGICTIVTSVPHGLSIGNRVALTGITGTNPPNGSYAVVGIVSDFAFAIGVSSDPSGLSAGNVYVRPPGQVLHRPFDGGVIFSSNAVANYETQIRQTRRYFRYQSGKGIQVSSGTIIRPSFQVDSLTSVGTAATVITKEQHNIQPGTGIVVSGANESAYNGSFVVNSIKGFNTFEYTMAGAASSTVASGNYYVGVTTWFGSTNRLGIFDEQNGLFFEYDGQQLYVVRRSSTFQISGKVSVTNGSNTVTQTGADFPTYFSKQLNIGDMIVLRGQSYRVLDIASDTSLTITPSYRGNDASYVICSRTIDTKIPQSQWNIDKCDGTGPSGYTIDLSKMQMFYVDYSWYGAGFVRWGFRGQDGNVFYAHKLANNNVNSEAYMRSGNLPARYESSALPPITKINSTVNASDTYVGVASTAGFPVPTTLFPVGTLVIRDGQKYEYVNYTGIGTTSFTGVTRAGVGGTSLITITQGSNSATGVTTTNLQVGMRILHPSFPEGTWITSVGVSNINLCQAATASVTSGLATFPSMGSGGAQTFTYDPLNPAAVELAYPTFGPTISHWGTSAIMDGRFDDDKSLVFTYGQTTSTQINANQSRALFSIRVAPSVDNGTIGTAFGARELINRMQLTLKTLDISIAGISTANVLVRAYLNAVPSSTTNWTNAVGNVVGSQNSSLAQIADYAGGSTTVSNGEVTAGFWVNGTGSIDISGVRDLGNCILGGGAGTSNTQIYPDGPDVLTIVATNYTPSLPVNIQARLSWTEAQA